MISKNRIDRMWERIGEEQYPEDYAHADVKSLLIERDEMLKTIRGQYDTLEERRRQLIEKDQTIAEYLRREQAAEGVLADICEECGWEYESKACIACAIGMWKKEQEERGEER